MRSPVRLLLVLAALMTSSAACLVLGVAVWAAGGATGLPGGLGVVTPLVAPAAPGGRAGPAPVGPAAAAAAVSWALGQLGTPYRWGGEGPGGFDCSGLVQAAYGAAGVRLPRVAQDQYDAGPRLPARRRASPRGPRVLRILGDGGGPRGHRGGQRGDGRRPPHRGRGAGGAHLDHRLCRCHPPGTVNGSVGPVRSPPASLDTPPPVSPVSPAPFAARAADALDRHGPLVLGLDPSGDLLAEWGLGDTADGLERFVDIAVEASVGTVGVVKPQAAFYERHGWRGIRSLARLVEECRAQGVLVLLDAKRGDVGSTNVAYAEAYLGTDAGIAVDAVTITPYLGLAAMAPILDRAVAAGAGVFVVTRSSNTEGRSIQTALQAGSTTVEHRLVIDIAAHNARVAPGTIGPIGAVFGPTHGPPTDVDLSIMNGLFLAPGVGTQGATPADVAACFAACPDRVLPSASRSLLGAGPDVARLRAATRRLAAELHEALAP